MNTMNTDTTIVGESQQTQQTQQASDVKTVVKAMPFLPSPREMIAEALKEHHEAVVKESGDMLLTANQVLEALKAENRLPAFIASRLKAANSTGDILGTKHLNLPFWMAGTKRVYLVPAIGWSPEERDAFDLLSSKEKSVKLEAMRQAFAAAAAA